MALACSPALATQAVVPEVNATEAPAHAAGSAPLPVIRLVEDGPVTRLETAVVHLEHPDGPKLDIFAAVHIADSAYYDRLDEEFADYDRVLFELVTDEEADMQAQLGALADGQRRDGDFGGTDRFLMELIGRLQRGMSQALDLHFQTEEIDYLAANFVHADLTSQQLSATLEKAGATLLEELHTLETQQQLSPAQTQQLGQQMLGAVAAALTGNTLPGKRLLASVLVSQVPGMAAAETSILIHGRNDAALAVLDQQLESGSDELALFYGAAHVPDLIEGAEERGFEVQGVDWLPAWVMDPATDSQPSDSTGQGQEPAAHGPATDANAPHSPPVPAPRPELV